MRERLKRLAKDSVVYGIGGILAKGVTFFLLPVYTRLFLPADYGMIELLSVLAALLGTLLGMGMESALSFYFFERKEGGRAEQARLVTAVLQWRLVWGALMVGAASLSAPLLNAYFFAGKLSWAHFAVAFSGALFLQVMVQSAEVFRLLYRPWPYVGITFVHAALSAAIAIALIAGLGWGTLGYFVGHTAGAVIAAVIGWYGIRAYLDLSRWHRDWWPELFRFGWPLVPASLIMWVMNTADRWFVSYYHAQEALGLYAVGGKFALLIALATEMFRKAWWPMAMEALHEEDGPRLFQVIARLYLGLGLAGVVVLTLVSPWLVRLFAAPAYQAAYPMVGVLAFSSIFYGFFLISAAGIWRSKQNWWTTIALAGGAALNLLLDWLWVPAYAGLGAAAATSVAMLASNVIAMAVGERLWPVRFPYGVLIAQLAVAGAGAAGVLAALSGLLAPWLAIGLTVAAVALLIALALGRRGLAELKTLRRRRPAPAE